MTDIPVYAAAEYAKGMQGRVIAQITAVERQTVDDKPAVVVYFRKKNGECFGVALDRHLADELTEQLGPHPLIEEFFRLH